MKFTSLIATCFVNRNTIFTCCYYVYWFKGKKLSCMTHQAAILFQVKTKSTIVSLPCDKIYFWFGNQIA